MGSWFVKPETVRIDIDEGQWIRVKKRLTVGEERKSHAALVKEVRQDGRITPNMEMMGKAEVMAYLIDWSLCDDEGAPIKLDTEGKLADAIDSLSPEHFKIISSAISTHIDKMEAERVERKNVQTTVSAPVATS